MGVVPDKLEWAGHEFRGIGGRQVLPGAAGLRPGELSGDVAALQNLKAIAAENFARAKDDGLVKTGDGLVHFARTTVDLDNQSADVIQQLFPDPPPGPGGGQ